MEHAVLTIFKYVVGNCMDMNCYSFGLKYATAPELSLVLSSGVFSFTWLVLQGFGPSKQCQEVVSTFSQGLLSTMKASPTSTHAEIVYTIKLWLTPLPPPYAHDLRYRYMYVHIYIVQTFLWLMFCFKCHSLTKALISLWSKLSTKIYYSKLAN